MPDFAPAPGDDPDDGERALRALFDIGQQRRALDEAELDAVRAARRSHPSWAGIATKLGITRHSAWEKWRDLDEAGAALGPTSRGGGSAGVREPRRPVPPLREPSTEVDIDLVVGE